MKGNRIIRHLALLGRTSCVSWVFLMVVPSAWSEVAYLKVPDEMGFSAMTNAASWAACEPEGPSLGEPGEALPANVDYIARRQIRTPFDSLDFPGKTLTVRDELDLLNLFGVQAYVFPNLILESGCLLSFSDYAATIGGTITVTATAESPFEISTCQRAAEIAVLADVSGTEDAALWIFSHRTPQDGWGARASTLRFSENALAGYSGVINLNQFSYPNRFKYSASSDYRAELKSASVDTPASVVVGRHCRIGGAAGGDVFAVKNIEFADKAGLSIAYDETLKMASLVKVTGELLVDGKVTVWFAPSANVTDVPDLAILKAPAGTTLDVDDYVLALSYPVFELQVKTDSDGLSTLFLHWCGPVVVQQSHDDGMSGDNAYVSGARWSDGLPPDGTKVYVSDYELRNSGNWQVIETAFPGRTLVKGGAVSASVVIFSPKMTVEDFRTYGANGVEFIANTYGGYEFAGHILHMKSACTGGLRIPCNSLGTVSFTASIAGDGGMYVYNRVGQPGVVQLLGDNNAFSGRLFLMSESANPDNYATLQFEAPAALGGEVDGWKYDYHTIKDYGRLAPTQTMTLDRTNCGFYVAGPAGITCAENVEFTLLERITWGGTLTKYGSGVLALGGSAPSFETDGGTSPVAGRNELIVSEGALKPASAEAFQGVHVSLAEGTRIVIDVPRDATAGVGKYGMMNTLLENPFSLPAGGVEVDVRDPNGDLDPSRDLVRPLVVPVMTVTQTAAENIRGKLHPKSPYQRYDVKVVEVENDGFVTFAAKLNSGFAIIVR